MDPAGNLYGTTIYGGAGSDCGAPSGCGTAYELSPAANGQWNETVLYNFCALNDCDDGSFPGSTPTLGPGGVVYGVAGTAFELVPGAKGWTFSVLYSFCQLPNCADGYGTDAPLTLDAKGNLSRISVLASWPPSTVHPTASVGAAFFILSIPSDCGGRERAGAASSRYRKTRKGLISSDFSHTSPSSSFLRHFCLPAAVPYPVCKGSAAIRRTMLPNSRRVRWLSASSSQ